MAGELVHALEDESPGHVSGTADNLAVHEVAQTYGAGAERNIFDYFQAEGSSINTNNKKYKWFLIYV